MQSRPALLLLVLVLGAGARRLTKRTASPATPAAQSPQAAGASPSTRLSQYHPRLTEYMRSGRESFEAQQYAAAAAGFRRATQVQPNLPEAWLDLGASVQRQGHRAAFREAAEAYSTAAGLAPTRESAHVGLGLALRSLGRVEEAIRAYKVGVTTLPDSAELHHGLGVSLLEQGVDEAQAGRALTRVLELRSPRLMASAYNNLGLIETEDSLALQHFHEAIALQPLKSDFYNNLGERQPETSQKIKAFEAALRLNPQNSQAYMNLANTLRADPDRALPLYETALHLEPHSARSQYNAATVYGEDNQMARQWDGMRRAFSLWWGEFQQAHEGGCHPRLVQCWWDLEGASVKPVSGLGSEPGRVYSQKGVGEIQKGPWAPHNNHMFSDKRPLAVVLQQASLEGTAGILRVGCDVLLGSARMYSPLHEQNLRPPNLTNKPSVNLPEAISLVSHASANFFHFLCEVLPRLVLSRATWPALFHSGAILIRDRERKVPRTPKGFILETMKAFGVENFITYEPDQVYKVNKLHVVEWWPTEHRRATEFDAPAAVLRATRAALRSTFGVSSAGVKPVVVWVSRSTSRERSVMNEMAILEVIRAGLPEMELVVWHGTEGMKRAAELFGSAAVVVGPHGAGLANLMFCNQCKLVELAVRSAQMRYYAHLATALGVGYEGVLTFDGFRVNAEANPVVVLQAIKRARQS